jgi:hypothetical protein
VLLFIVGATGLTIHGELQFSVVGFTVQSASMLCEGMKLTLQSYSLSASGKRLDALTYVMLVAPMVLCVLSLLLCLLCIFWPSRPEALSLPPREVIVEHRWLLLGNGMLAFAMNISHALFIKNSSAITFILTGVVMKDVVIVVAASIILGEILSPLQVCGFAMQLIGILAWSLMKAFPQLLVRKAIPDALKQGDGHHWEALTCEPCLSPDANVHSSSNLEEETLTSETAAEACEAAFNKQCIPGLASLSKASSQSTLVPFDDDMSSCQSSVSLPSSSSSREPRPLDRCAAEQSAGLAS